MKGELRLDAGEVQQIIALHLKEKGINVKKVTLVTGMTYPDRMGESQQAVFKNAKVEIELGND